MLCSAPILFAQSATSTGLLDNPVFQNNCARCHGKAGTGHMVGPPSLVSGKVPQRSPDDIRAVVSNGKGRMPKFGDKLTADEIDTLVQQIKNPPAK